MHDPNGWSFSLWFVRQHRKKLWHVDNPDTIKYVTMCGLTYQRQTGVITLYEKEQQPPEGAPVCEVCKGMLTRYILRYGLPQQEGIRVD